MKLSTQMCFVDCSGQHHSPCWGKAVKQQYSKQEIIHQFSARISGNTCATTNTPFNFALESAYKINNKETPFLVFTFEEIQMSILDCPDIACTELFTATVSYSSLTNFPYSACQAQIRST